MLPLYDARSDPLLTVAEPAPTDKIPPPGRWPNRKPRRRIWGPYAGFGGWRPPRVAYLCDLVLQRWDTLRRVAQAN